MAVEPIGFVKRMGIDRDCQPEGRTLPVVSGDAIEKGLHDGANIGAAIEIRGVQLRNGGFLNGK